MVQYCVLQHGFHSEYTYPKQPRLCTYSWDDTVTRLFVVHVNLHVHKIRFDSKIPLQMDSMGNSTGNGLFFCKIHMF